MGAALNDLAYAVNDTIKDPANFKPLNELIQDMITELKNTVNNVNTAVANVNTAVGTVNTNLAGGKVPVVRKIQRGTGSISAIKTSVTITLSGFTNINKMIVLLDGGKSANGGSYDASFGITRLPYVGSLSTSSLTVKSDNTVDSECSFSYQVIELW